MPPPNPIRAAWEFLKGTDLQVAERPVPEVKQSSFPYVPPGWAGGLQDALALGYGGTGNSDFNSAVFACLMALSLAHIEPPLKVYRGNAEGDADWLLDSPLQLLLEDPNPVHTSVELWFWTSWAKHLDGNAYLRKVRSGDPETGNVIELWPISPALIKPYTAPGAPNFIDHYHYTPAAGPPQDISFDNIIHFRIGIDDRDHRVGLSPIRRLVREITSDENATAFTNALLRNFGIPGLVVKSPAGAPSINEEEAEAIKARISAAFGSDNRGNVGLLTGGADMSTIGFSPEQLNLEVLHNVPETRIAAVMGVPPAVAGLGVGLAQTSNYASMKQVRENFTEVTVVPTWRMDAAKLNKRLKPDFTPERDVYIQYDVTEVRALQEDRNQLFTRLDNAVRTGWVTPNEARSEVGLPPMDGGDVPTPQPAFGAGQPPQPTAALPPPPAKSIELKAGEITAETLQALVELSVPGLTEDLDRYFDGVRRRTKRALLSERSVP